ncbi:DUF1361 domain-containing protein [Anaerosphaera multitolerans]|uniref:DUF1361 domain-containing protein n=1 Tax=Anaerosphaera multitolerans TaxID=2487351 RepID=A0A437S960_9FIRM|nr:DUF1361 domain-containing protein [Anaerosphaera multitolerans]RVU55368.1 DUF1361 domain-containing protein [Anaerosphaera multitolerans]
MRTAPIILAALLLNIFAFITIVLRPKLFKVKLFKPMVWNFKLSLLPFFTLVVSIILFISLRYISTISGIMIIDYVGLVLFIIGLVLWLLLLPNSGYLITELNLTHREMDENEVPIWYDIVSILSFSLSGIVNTLVNIVLVQGVYLIYLDPSSVSELKLIFSALIINVLVSVGIYFGRAIRFNSWDILHITSFFKKLADYFSKRGNIKDFLLFVLFHTTFFMLMYMSFGVKNYFLYN